MAAKFFDICINWDELLETTELSKILKLVIKQAKTSEAKKRADIKFKPEEYSSTEWSPMYFGLFNEWLAEHFLNYFGHHFGVHSVKMNASNDLSNTKDLGVDGYAKSISSKSYCNDPTIKPKTNSRVFIQVKGTVNSSKIYQANDGSRISNFMANAQGEARNLGIAYQGRYVLFTTGEGIHYTLDEMTYRAIEVIGFKKISKLMKDNYVFLNYLRVAAGLLELPEPNKSPDIDFNCENFEIETGLNLECLRQSLLDANLPPDAIDHIIYRQYQNSVETKSLQIE